MKQELLRCGTLSSFFYIGMNVLMPLLFEYYGYGSHSELSAIGAPTKQLWVPLIFVYMLFADFGLGVLKSANRNCHLSTLASIAIAYCEHGTFIQAHGKC